MTDQDMTGAMRPASFGHTQQTVNQHRPKSGLTPMQVMQPTRSCQ